MDVKGENFTVSIRTRPEPDDLGAKFLRNSWIELFVWENETLTGWYFARNLNTGDTQRSALDGRTGPTFYLVGPQVVAEHLEEIRELIGKLTRKMGNDERSHRFRVTCAHFERVIEVS